MDLAGINIIMKSITHFFSRFIDVLIFFIIGWAAAYLFREFLDWFLKNIGFDNFARRIGFEEFLKKGKVDYTPSKLIATLVYWLIIIFILFIGISFLGGQTIQTIINKMSLDILNFVEALLILIIGLLIINFIGNFVRTLANNTNIPQSSVLEKIIKYGGTIFIIFIALESLGIGKSILIFGFQLILGGFIFAVSLAFGIGCKDIIKNYVEKSIKNIKNRNKPEEPPDMEG